MPARTSKLYAFGGFRLEDLASRAKGAMSRDLAMSTFAGNRAGRPIPSRIEFRLPGADTNPHLAFTLLLGAGLHGIERKLAVPPATVEIGRALVHPVIGPLPRTLMEAAERMQRSTRAREMFGARFVEHFTASCIEEDNLMRRHIAAFERRRYLHHV